MGRTRKIQSRIEPELETLVKKQKDYTKMSDYIRKILIQKTKFKTELV